MAKLNRKQFYNLTVGKDINGKDIKKNDDKFVQYFDIIDRDIQRYLTHKRGKDGAMSFFILVAIVRSTQFDSNNKWYNDNLLVMSDDDIMLNIGKTSSPTIRKYIKILIDEKFLVGVSKGRGNVRIIEIDWNKLKLRYESLRGYAKKLDEEYFSGRNKEYKARIKADDITNEPTLEPEINVEEEIVVNTPPVVVKEKIEPKKVEKVVEEKVEVKSQKENWLDVESYNYKPKEKTYDEIEIERNNARDERNEWVDKRDDARLNQRIKGISDNLINKEKAKEIEADEEIKRLTKIFDFAQDRMKLLKKGLK